MTSVRLLLDKAGYGGVEVGMSDTPFRYKSSEHRREDMNLEPKPRSSGYPNHAQRGARPPQSNG